MSGIHNVLTCKYMYMQYVYLVIVSPVRSTTGDTMA